MDLKSMFRSAKIEEASMKTPATMARARGYAHAESDTYPTGKGTPNFVFDVTRVADKPAKSGSALYHLTGGGSLLVNQYEKPFARAGVLWEDGYEVDTLAAGVMFMAYLPDVVAKQLWDALEAGRVQPGNAQIHFWDAELGDTGKAPYPMMFQGRESLIQDARIQGNYTFALVTRGEHWITLREMPVFGKVLRPAKPKGGDKKTITSLDDLKARIRTEVFETAKANYEAKTQSDAIISLD